VSAFFCFGGWWEATKLGGEIEDARRDLPRALALGVSTLVVLYVAVSVAFLLTAPSVASEAAPSLATQAGAALLGGRGGSLLAGVIAGCVLGSLLGSATMAPRVYYAMAQDGLAPAFVGRLDPRSGAPTGAVLVQGMLAALLVVLGSFEGVIAYFVFATVGFIGLAVLGVFVLRKRLGPSPLPAAGFPWTAVYFLFSTALVLALVGLGRPLESALGALVVLLGWPIYKLRARTVVLGAA
jgi:basic amino acid/polyamine antiporter, APA family